VAARGACANRLSEPVYPYGRAYPAGGIVDIATRIVTDKLSEIWHQPIVVEAKPGASGTSPGTRSRVLNLNSSAKSEF